ncbi:ATP-binding protein [Caulobacter endophyticus]|uniref:ATP-binding protein n=1 Tax=Caulobacter endophyticus TaxID=2172652 RepID=UPI002410B25E|nr:ATP-binding protein [Caulobacter endophyticus]MDG2527881.1 ATP-binding protein [Caulobacter endophyticus]
MTGGERLSLELARIAALLGVAVARRSDKAEAVEEALRGLEEAKAALAADPGADAGGAGLARRLGLTSFETDVVLLAAGAQMTAAIPRLCALAAGDPRAAYPTLAVALETLAEPAWSAFAPDAPLRRLRLITLATPSHPTASELTIDERVLHALLGVATLDADLAPRLQPVGPVAALPASLSDAAETVTRAWRAAAPPPVAILQRADMGDARAVAAQACARLGLPLWRLNAIDAPASPVERHQMLALWEREARLTGAALLIEAPDDLPPELNQRLSALVERIAGPVLVSTREAVELERPHLLLPLSRPTRPEQGGLWQGGLGAAGRRLNGGLDRLVQQFDLSATDIGAVSGRVLADPGRDTEGLLWRECRDLTRRRLGDLAQRLEPKVGWDDLILPAMQGKVLRDLAAQVRHRHVVYQNWGFSAGSSRGLGVSALFAGPSGTGKTMAAEVIAGELGLDLFRIDLAGTVSKYIGETEKNLRRIFDAAEGSGAILLFDEADALFGKRSDVSDAHDRYANIEVSYLLQRMEAYSGLAILTTNKRDALDEAFLRRIRFVVAFPFPDEAQRREVWGRSFPSAARTSGIDLDKLARLGVPPGNIRNIALNAAFLAAGEGAAIGMGHLRQAAMAECAKIEKSPTPSEIGGWS